MKEQASRGLPVIIISLMFAIVLTLLPLPDMLEALRPNLPLMFVIYWIMALPHRIGIMWAWFVGILVDVVLGNVLGIHGFAFGIIAYLVQILAHRLRLFPYWKQSMVVGLFVSLDLLIAIWLENFIADQPRQIVYWLPGITSTILWLPIFISLRGLRRAYKVS
jgi:rod shape-determining protein MreD